LRKEQNADSENKLSNLLPKIIHTINIFGMLTYGTLFETLVARCSPIQISATLEKVLEPLVKAICNHNQESSDKHPHPDSLLFLNFLLVLLYMALLYIRSIWPFDTNVIKQKFGCVSHFFT